MQSPCENLRRVSWDEKTELGDDWCIHPLRVKGIALFPIL